MKLNLEKYSLIVDCWGSEQLMEEYLDGCSFGTINLDKDSDYKQDYYTVKVANHVKTDESFGIGLKFIANGLSIEIFSEFGDDRLLIGYGQHVSCICLKTRTLLYEIDLSGKLAIFYQFIRTSIPDQLIILGEIGAVMVNTEGKILWEYSLDIVTDWELSDKYIHLRHMDSPSAKIEIETGEVHIESEQKK